MKAKESSENKEEAKTTETVVLDKVYKEKNSTVTKEEKESGWIKLKLTGTNMFNITLSENH